MTSVKNIARALLVTAALTCGLAAAPGIAAADVAVEIDLRLTDPGDWPWENLPVAPK